MKKYISIILGLIFTVTLSAQDFIGTISGSGNTLGNHPVEAAIDGDDSTAMKFKLQQSNGWLKISLADNELIEYMDFTGIIPEGVTAHLQYEEDGFVKAFPSSFVSGINDTFRIDVSEDHIVTDSVYLQLDGDRLDQVEINEVLLESLSYETARHMTSLSIDEESVNTSTFTGIQHMLDGKIGTVWWAWNNEDWKKSHWFVRESLDEMYPVRKTNNQWNRGFAVLIPDEEKPQTEVKLFVHKFASGNLTLTVKGGQSNATLQNAILDEYRGRWLTVNTEGIGDVKEIRLDVSGTSKAFGGIGEVELWGEIDPPHTQYNELIPFIPGSGINYSIFSIEELSFDDTYRLDVLVDADDEHETAAKINGFEVTAERIEDVNGFIRYRYLLDDRSLVLGDNILELSVPEASTVIQAQLLLLQPYDILELEYSHLTDGRLYSGESSGNTFLSFVQGMSKADSIRLYYTGTAPSGVYCKLGEQIVYPAFVKDTGVYVEYTMNTPVTGVGITSPGGMTEIVVSGNPLEIKKPFVKLLYPRQNMSMLLNETTFKPIWGITDMPGAYITINGQQVKKYGNYFYLDPSKKKTNQTGSFSAEAKLYFNDEEYTDKVNYIVQSESYNFSLDQEDILYRTKDSTFRLSGQYNPWVSSVYVNGEKVGAAYQPSFSYNLPLENGLNIVRIELRDKNGVDVKEVHIRKIYKESLSRQLTISSPSDGTVINTDTVTVSGYANPYGLESVTANGISSVMKNGRYSCVIPVTSSETDITVLSTYDDDETLIQQVTVFKDTVAPVIENVTPAPESWHAIDVIEFEGNVYDEHSAAVYINGKKADVIGDYFSADIDVSEYENTIYIKAVDNAGNITDYPGFQVYVDLTQPEPFEVSINPESWTNNTRPILEFSTTDSYSHMNHYEISINGKSFLTQDSPFQTPFLPDGKIPIIVRAYDNVGNYRDAEVTAFIDTTPPDEPTSFRAVPGNGNVTLRWSESFLDEETVLYRIISPNGTETQIERYDLEDEINSGNINEENQIEYYEYSYEGLVNGEDHIYKIYSVDHAGNLGNVVQDSVTPGIQITEYNDKEGTVVEYGNIILTVPFDSLPDEVDEIIVTEIESGGLNELSIYPIISPIYDFSVQLDDGSFENHVSFDESFIGSISYDELLVPEGFPEQNLGVYFFDSNWSRWTKVTDSAVDIENNTIYFSTNHFSEFSVQPTVIEDLSPQELANVEFSPFSSKIQHQAMSVSPQGGGASTSMTELSLPGKNGFDFELRRIYDTATAKGDSAGLKVNVSMSWGDIVDGNIGKEVLLQVGTGMLSYLEASIKQYFQNNGDYAYALGQGWRLNLPYIRGANGGVLVRTPSGSFYDISSMNVRYDGSILAGVYRKVIFENHEHEDFVLEVEQERTDINITSLVLSGKPSIPGWTLSKATLRMKDGSSYEFDNYGRFISSTDGTGLNTIVAEYDGLTLDSISDTMGRKIRFSYTDIFDISVMPQIDRIWIEDDPLDREITYEYANPSDMQEELDLIAPVHLPLLHKALDINEREWEYDYDYRFLFTGEFGVKVNVLASIANFYTGGISEKLTNKFGLSAVTIHTYANSQWTFPMKEMSGVGIGETDLTYTTKTLGYFDVSLADFFLGIIPTAVQMDLGIEQRPLVKKLILSLDTGLVKKETYEYDFKYAGDKQNFVQKSIRDDGVIRELNYYDFKKKTRLAYFDWSDYLASAATSPFMDAVWRTDIIPVNSTTSQYDSVTGEHIQTVEKEYYKSNLQPKKITTSRSGDYYTVQNFIYDEWGNHAKVSTNTMLGERTRKTVAYNMYYDNGDDPAELLEVAWDNTQHDALSLKSGLSERHGLLLGTQTINYDTYHNTSVTSEQYHSYDSYGQLSKTRVRIANTGVDSDWSETVNTYDYNAPLTGELVSTIKPDGHIISRTYDFSRDDVYTVTETQNEVTNTVDTTVTDIITTKAYDYIMGYLAWSTDGRGFTTEYEFDKIGRTTKILFPDDDSAEQGWDPLSGAIDRTNNPVTTVVYNDDDLTVTETKRNGSAVIYTFDNLTRLKQISKLSGEHMTYFEYDSYNNITKYTNTNNDVTDFTYSPLGEMTSETYLEKNAAIERGGSDKELTKTIEYNYADLSRTITNERGILQKEYSDFNNKPIHAIQYGLYGEEYSHEYSYYDGLGNIIATIDPEGNETSTIYNSRNLVEKTITPLCEYLINGTKVNKQVYQQFEYNAAGYKTDEYIGYDSTNVSHTAYDYDGLGRTTSTTQYWTDVKGPYRVSTTKQKYDANGNVIIMQDPRNNHWIKTYTARNKLNTESDPLGNVTSYTYDVSDRMTTMTDARGNSGNYSDLDFSIDYTYDDLDRLTIASIPARIDPLTGTLSGKPTVSFTYDKMNNVLTRTEPDEGVTTYTYSQRKRVLTETKSGTDKSAIERSYTTWNEYDEAGNIIKTTLPNLTGFTSYEYDALNRVSSQTTNGNAQILYGYDKNGNQTAMKTQNGYYHYFKYDSLNRLVEEQDEEDFITYNSYDVLGNVCEQTDAIGNTFKSDFDEAGHLMRETDGRGKISTYTYDLAGNLTGTTDPNGTEITNTYLANNLLSASVYTSTDEPATQSVSYAYDEAGAIKQITDTGITTKYNFIDGTYRPDPYDMKFNVETVGYSSVDYDYDIMNRMTAITYDQGMNVSYNYNNLSQLEDVAGYISGITYDSNGLKDTTTFNNGMTLSYAFTDRQELDTIDYATSTATLKEYDYAYDLAGNVIAENQNLFAYDGKNQMITAMIISEAAETEYQLETVFSGQAEEDILGEGSVAWHDPVNLSADNFTLDWGARSLGIGLDYSYRVKTIVLHRSSNAEHRVEKSNISVYASLYNRDESFVNINSFTLEEDEDTGDLTITFSDAVFGRIFKIHSHFNDLDTDGNPLNINATLELASDNPIEVWAVTAGRNEFYGYDGKGNRQTKTIMSEGFDVSEYSYYPGSDLIKSDGVNGYIYDDNGNMIEKGVLLSETDDSVVLDTAEEGYFQYTYDLKNRLTEVSAYKDGEIKTVAEYLYDTHNLRIEKTDGEGLITKYIYDVNGHLLEEKTDNEYVISYVYVNGRHVARVTASETLYYGLNNVGSTVFMADSDGDIVWSGDITPYGDSQTSSGTVDDKVAFSGKQLDTDTGLFYFNNRWYNPDMGRFITKDPIRDGQNWYIYVSNNPLKFVDPTGLEQNLLQVLATKGLKYASEKSPVAKEIIKIGTKISIQRSTNDNGENGTYFQSSESVTFFGIPLNRIDVQSTADYTSKVNAGKGRTIPAGEYTGTLLNKSGSYNNAISITGNGVSESEAVLAHPNSKTAQGSTTEYADGTRPYSAACQISHLEDFNEVTGILTDIGFEYGNGEQAWAKGDTIKIDILAPKETSED